MKILAVNGGNGVICYPMRKYLMGNVEIRSNFKTSDNIQWWLNFKNIPLITKAEGLTSFDKPDIIMGAPNCGHSSILAYSRAKKLSDPMKDESFELFLTSIDYYKPKIFMMENLPKILDMVSEDVWRTTFPEYNFIFHKESVSAWGNSQITRKRLMIIGYNKEHFRDHLREVQYHFYNLYKVKELKTCNELMLNLEDEDHHFGHIRENIDEIITMYAGYKISLSDAQIYWKKTQNTRWKVEGKKFSTAPAVYRNHGDRYPMVARKANRQFNENGLQLTPRELARIQGVPDCFKIYIELGNKNFWINKGRTTVTKSPPYEMGRWFYKQLIKIKSWI